MDKEIIELRKINRKKERLEYVKHRRELRIQNTKVVEEYRKADSSIDIEKQVRLLIKLTREGYSKNEIADMMGCEEEYIDELKSYCKKWFSDEQLKKFAEKRKELSTRTRKSGGHQGKITTNIRNSEAIDVLQKSLKMMRKSAQREDEMQLSGEINIGIQKRKNFAQGLTKLFELGGSVSEEDIELLLDMCYTSPEIANKGNIRFLVLSAFKSDGAEAARERIDELMVSLKGNKYYNILSDYEKWIDGMKGDKEASEIDR